MKKLLIFSLIFSLFLTGCTNPTSGGSETTDTSEIIESTETDIITDVTEAPVIEDVDYKSNFNKNSHLIDILGETADNVVISDFSINMALSMALEGAEGNTQKELENYLNKTKEENLIYNKQLLEDAKNVRNIKLEVANSLWYNKTLEVKDTYKKLLEENYEAQIENVDMQDPATVGKINKWCSDKTHELIPEIIGSTDNIESVLINALYFKANWLEEFYEGATKKETFKGSKGDIEVDMMHSTEATYLENEHATGFIKHYYDGYAFVGILPKNEGAFNLTDLDIEGLIKSQTHKYDVKVGLPKFKVEYETSLLGALHQFGIKDAFDPNAANFEGIAENLFITDIIHKTYISVDEIGTEAAAVTAITMDNAAFAPEQREVKDVVLDRPFAFAIIKTDNNNILFSGKITNIEQ